MFEESTDELLEKVETYFFEVGHACSGCKYFMRERVSEDEVVCRCLALKAGNPHWCPIVNRE